MDGSPERSEQIKEIIGEFVSRLELPSEKAPKPSVIGIVGNIGSGKSTVVHKLVEQLPGTVYIQGDSARFLLKEHALSWGDNVKSVTDGVIQELIRQGYAVITDAFTTEAKDRDRLATLALDLSVPVKFFRVRCDESVCRERLGAKYDDTSWESTFEHFRVNTTEKMLANFDERSRLHRELQNKDIEHYAGEIDNSGPVSALDEQIPALVKQLLD